MRGGDLRLSLCSGVFSDGNFTYIVEPREMARPQEPPQVSPSRSPLTACYARTSSWLVPMAVAASSPGNLSLPALLSHPSSGSLPLCPQLQCPLCPPSNLPSGSSVLCPYLSGRPQVLTPESEHLGDQIRHGSSGQFWVTLGWGGGKGWSCPPSGLRSRPGRPPPKNYFPLISGTPSPPHLPDPSPPSPSWMQGTR